MGTNCTKLPKTRAHTQQVSSRSNEHQLSPLEETAAAAAGEV